MIPFVKHGRFPIKDSHGKVKELAITGLTYKVAQEGAFLSINYSLINDEGRVISEGEHVGGFTSPETTAKLSGYLESLAEDIGICLFGGSGTEEVQDPGIIVPGAPGAPPPGEGPKNKVPGI